MPTDLPRINLTLSQPLYDLLRRMADLNSISMSGLVASMLEAHTHQLTMLLNATEAYTKTNHLTGQALDCILGGFQESLNADVDVLNRILNDISSEIASSLPAGVGDPDRAPARTGSTAAAAEGSTRPAKRSRRSAVGAPPPYSNTGVTPAMKASHATKRLVRVGHR